MPSTADPVGELSAEPDPVAKLTVGGDVYPEPPEEGVIVCGELMRRPRVALSVRLPHPVRPVIPVGLELYPIPEV